MQISTISKEQKYLEKIIKKYEEKELTKLDQLRALDKKAKRPALIFAYIFGSISSLILGFGMSIAMGVIFENLMIVGVIIGCIGLLFTIINYPIYKKILKKSIKKYADRIITLSNEIINK